MCKFVLVLCSVLFTVIRELDSMKQREGLLRRSSKATSVLRWIDECMENESWWIHVQGTSEMFPVAPTPPATPSAQRIDEEIKFSSSAFNPMALFSPRGFADIVSPKPEDRVLDCALFFKKSRSEQRMVVLSHSITLKIKAMAEVGNIVFFVVVAHVCVSIQCTLLPGAGLGLRGREGVPRETDEPLLRQVHVGGQRAERIGLVMPGRGRPGRELLQQPPPRAEEDSAPRRGWAQADPAAQLALRAGEQQQPVGLGCLRVTVFRFVESQVIYYCVVNTDLFLYCGYIGLWMLFL
jgi:hypothetical protein